MSEEAPLGVGTGVGVCGTVGVGMGVFHDLGESTRMFPGESTPIDEDVDEAEEVGVRVAEQPCCSEVNTPLLLLLFVELFPLFVDSEPEEIFLLNF